MEMIKVTVEGVSPLLMNRFRDAQIEGKSKRRTGAQTEMSLKDKLYLPDGDDGKPHVPGIYFRNAIIEASKQFKISGKGKSTYSKLVGATVDVIPELIPIEPGTFTEFRVAAVNPMTKGRMMVSRPRFDKWNVKFDIVLNDDSVPAHVMKEILDQAGKYVGVGDWRPEKKGMFGKFMVTEFKTVK